MVVSGALTEETPSRRLDEVRSHRRYFTDLAENRALTVLSPPRVPLCGACQECDAHLMRVRTGHAHHDHSNFISHVFADIR